MTNVPTSALRTATLGDSVWKLARADPKWLGRYVGLVVLDLLILAFIVLAGVTDWFPPAAQLSYVLLVPALTLLSVYAGMSPGYFVAREGIKAISRSAPEMQVWKLSAHPLNVDTIRKWASRAAPKASLRRPTFVGFGPDSMTIWVKDGMSISEVLTVPRGSVSVLRVIQNGTRPVINLGSAVEQSNQMVFVASKGDFSWSPAYLMNGAAFVEGWVAHGSNHAV